MAGSTMSTSYFWLLVAMGTYGIGAIVTAILFTLEFCHGIRFCHGPKLQRKKKTSTTSMWILTILAILGFCVTCSVAVTSKLTAVSHILPHIICYHFTKSASMIYIVAKNLMYLLFILRIYTVYKDTQYQYSSRFLIIIVLFSTLSTLFLLILMVFFGATDFISVVNTTFKNCIITFPVWCTGFAAINDLVNQALLIYLFVKPLILIQKNAQKQDGLRANGREGFKKLCLKYYILGLCACISTLLFLLSVPSIGTTFFAGIDCMVNSFCLLFCFHHWDKQYLFVCKLMIVVVEKLCFKQNKQNNQSKVQMHMDSIVLESVQTSTKPSTTNSET